MIKSFTLTVKYWWLVINRAFNLAVEKTGLKGLIYGVFLSVLLIIVVFILSVKGIIPKDTPILGETINNAWVQIGTGIVGLGTLLIILVFFLLYIPAKIFEEQGGFLVNPFNIQVISRDRELRLKKPVWASIEVHNIAQHDCIEDCYIRLDKVVNKSTEDSLLMNIQNLTWSSREHNPDQTGNQPIIINAQDFRVCDIAKTFIVNDEVQFTMWFGVLNIPPGSYELLITLFGNWKGISIHFPYSFDLDYKGDNELFLSLNN